ncbi:baseplate J/gp47 family protein [Massiliimalia timonensis]|uniref:baseplate J/gp47 family protein n=1 Tax=Massiliimalia timonensis TaxID=1987501 RepID=UPI000B8B2A07|nr:baseplate J/gp47 family protein [Massiliimalia timonensis]MBS7175578.1 baseplate J/gp47 family protein [Clostridiales bacterium]
MTYQLIYNNLKQTFEEESGYPVHDDSDLGIRMQVIAGELFHLSEQISFCEKQMFPQTATGEYLERHGVSRDLYKKKATAATGILRFSRSSAAAQDIVIPAGTLCTSSSSGGVMYATTEDGVISKGATFADIPAAASEKGGEGNILKGKIDTLVGTVAGVSSVTNPNNFSGGMEEESDQSFRKRLLDSYINPSNGANAKFYQEFALRYERVMSAKTEYQSSGNVLNLYVSDYFRMTDDDLIQQIQDDLKAEKELNVNVQVKAAIPVKQDIEVTVYAKNSQNTGMKQSQVISYLRQKTYELGVGEAFNPYSIAHDIAEQVDGILSISFVQPSGLVKVSAGQIISPGNMSVTVERG